MKEYKIEKWIFRDDGIYTLDRGILVDNDNPIAYLDFLMNLPQLKDYMQPVIKDLLLRYSFNSQHNPNEFLIGRHKILDNLLIISLTFKGSTKDVVSTAPISINVLAQLEKHNNEFVVVGCITSYDVWIDIILGSFFYRLDHGYLKVKNNTIKGQLNSFLSHYIINESVETNEVPDNLIFWGSNWEVNSINSNKIMDMIKPDILHLLEEIGIVSKYELASLDGAVSILHLNKEKDFYIYFAKPVYGIATSNAPEYHYYLTGELSIKNDVVVDKKLSIIRNKDFVSSSSLVAGQENLANILRLDILTDFGFGAFFHPSAYKVDSEYMDTISVFMRPSFNRFLDTLIDLYTQTNSLEDTYQMFLNYKDSFAGGLFNSFLIGDKYYYTGIQRKFFRIKGIHHNIRYSLPANFLISDNMFNTPLTSNAFILPLENSFAIVKVTPGAVISNSTYQVYFNVVYKTVPIYTATEGLSDLFKKSSREKYTFLTTLPFVVDKTAWSYSLYNIAQKIMEKETEVEYD
ncbi:MAG: hypothetical protein QXP36_00440 [Conexivisphaerales archaeon]